VINWALGTKPLLKAYIKLSDIGNKDVCQRWDVLVFPAQVGKMISAPYGGVKDS